MSCGTLNPFIVKIIILLGIFNISKSNPLPHRMKRQEPDIGGMMAQGAAAVLEVFQNGGAAKDKFAVGVPGRKRKLCKISFKSADFQKKKKKKII